MDYRRTLGQDALYAMALLPGAGLAGRKARGCDAGVPATEDRLHFVGEGPALGVLELALGRHRQPLVRGGGSAIELVPVLKGLQDSLRGLAAALGGVAVPAARGEL